MAESFCPECGTVFESTGTICPNCAATVGNASFVPKGKKGSAISVMPLAKDSGGRRGFAEIDGSQLDLRDRDYVQQQSAHAPSGPSLPESGLAVEGRPERAPQQMLAPEPPDARASAAQAEESADAGGWTRAVVIVLIVIAVAFGGKFVMNLVDDKAEQSDGSEEDGAYGEATE